MSLLDEYVSDYKILIKTIVDDGYGGYTTIWKEGVTIKGALGKPSETEVITAQAKGEKVTNTMLIDKALNLEYHTVLSRVSDGKILRVTSSGDEEYTPASSNLNKRKILCEEWEIPPDEQITSAT